MKILEVDLGTFLLFHLAGVVAGCLEDQRMMMRTRIKRGKPGLLVASGGVWEMIFSLSVPELISRVVGFRCRTLTQSLVGASSETS